MGAGVVLLVSPLWAALRVNGSTTVNAVVVEAADVLRSERGLEIQVDTAGGSSGGISALGEGRVEVAMSSRPLADADRAKYPAVAFQPVRIGEDAVALIVSRDVWEAGVHSLSAAEMRGIYEGRIANWKALGGPDRRIAFFNKEPGRGTWEVFAHWLYGDAKKAPLVSFPEVGANEEARAKVGSTRGALSQLSASWADGETVFALALETAAGVVAPTLDNIVDGSYPMRRSLFVITNGPPEGDARALVDLLLSPRGQELVKRHGFLGVTPARSTAP
jgi:phosphate transport system substrate-binding protein